MGYGLDTKDMERWSVSLRLDLGKAKRRFNIAQMPDTFQRIVSSFLEEQVQPSNTIELDRLNSNDDKQKLQNFLDHLVDRCTKQEHHELLQDTLRKTLQQSRRRCTLDEDSGEPQEPMCYFCAAGLKLQPPQVEATPPPPEAVAVAPTVTNDTSELDQAIQPPSEPNENVHHFEYCLQPADVISPPALESQLVVEAPPRRTIIIQQKEAEVLKQQANGINKSLSSSAKKPHKALSQLKQKFKPKRSQPPTQQQQQLVNNLPSSIASAKQMPPTIHHQSQQSQLQQHILSSQQMNVSGLNLSQPSFYPDHSTPKKNGEQQSLEEGRSVVYKPAYPFSHIPYLSGEKEYSQPLNVTINRLSQSQINPEAAPKTPPIAQALPVANISGTNGNNRKTSDKPKKRPKVNHHHRTPGDHERKN